MSKTDYMVVLLNVALAVMGRQLSLRHASPYWRRFFYAQSFAAPAFAATMLVTHTGPLALIVGVITTGFAAKDWNAHNPLGDAT